MSRHVKFDDNAIEKDWNELIALFSQVRDSEMMDQLLVLFLTINEREFLVQRLRIIRALLQGEMPQREIADKLKVSIAKITAGSNELKRTPKELKERIKRFIETGNIEKC